MKRVKMSHNSKKKNFKSEKEKTKTKQNKHTPKTIVILRLISSDFISSLRKQVLKKCGNPPYHANEMSLGL